MNDWKSNLRARGFNLPGFQKPNGSYSAFTKVDKLIFVSGQVCLRDGKLAYKGTVGVDVDIESAKEAAIICALNVLSVAHFACGYAISNLRLVKVNGYVKSAASFEEQSVVIEAASELFNIALGENKSAHARAAIGVSALPRGSPVEIDAIFAVD